MSRPTTDLKEMQRVFKQLLETPFGDKIPPDRFQNFIADEIPDENHPDILVNPDHPPIAADKMDPVFKLLGETMTAGNITVRQYLSAFARTEMQDHFCIEAVRNEAMKRHPKAYAQFINDSDPSLSGAGLPDYLRFFDTLTTIADKGKLPKNVKKEEVSKILKTGWKIIHNNASGLKATAGAKIAHMQSAGTLEADAMGNLAENYHFQLILSVYNPSYIPKIPIPDWIPKDLRDKIKANPHSRKYYPELLELVKKHHKIMPEDYKKAHRINMDVARFPEDKGDVHLALAGMVRQAIESLGINTAGRSDKPKS